MKILITSDWYKPVINGVVTSVVNLCDGLTALGHEVRVLTLSDSKEAKIEGNVYYFPSFDAHFVYPNARLKHPGSHKMIKELVDWKPDVIHSQCEFSSFNLAKQVAKKTKAPIVHTYHTVYEDYTHYFIPWHKPGVAIVKSFSKKISKKTDAIIAPSKKVSNLLKGYGIETPIYVIPSGLDLNAYKESSKDEPLKIRENLGIKEDECILIYVGRLAKEKNLDEIMKYLTDEKCPKIRFVIVGDGPCRKMLEEEAANLKLSDRVIFTGMVSPEAVPDYYRVGDIFVNASVSETQGLTYMEAMASKRALLCRKDPCLDDIITEGTNGFTYETKEDFIQYLDKLVKNNELRTSFGIKACETAFEKFSTEGFAKACTKVYESV
ncbi:MAG: glycosyltransferase family 4 protein [Lachnospiraceae bacterium]|nr:glycosyltransferase family 4 protein [Lachnospiraceae bacterium]